MLESKEYILTMECHKCKTLFRLQIPVSEYDTLRAAVISALKELNCVAVQPFYIDNGIVQGVLCPACSAREDPVQLRLED